MAVEVGLWRLDDKPHRISFSPMDAESRLEQILADDLTIIDPNLLLIGRQVPTAYGKFIDLLALDADANLVVIELKRDRTPREVVAQLLDYGSWLRSLEDSDVATIFGEFLVDDDSRRKVPILSLPIDAAKLNTLARDPEKTEHMVRVKWQKTVPESEGIKEKGFFGNQNSAAKPRAKRWSHTVERLKKRFEIDD